MLKSPIEPPQNIKVYRTLKNLDYYIFCTTPHKVQEGEIIRIESNSTRLTCRIDHFEKDIMVGGFIYHGIKSVLYNREKGDLKCTKLE